MLGYDRGYMRSANAPRHLIAAIAVAAAVLAMSCSSTESPTATPTVQATPTVAVSDVPSPAGSDSPVTGGVLRQMSITDPVSFDPHNAAASPDNVHNSKLYNNLVWNPDGNTIDLDVASSYQVSGDGRTITYFLRDDVLFQDGTPLTAKDVKYSLEKIMGLVDGRVSSRVGPIKEFISIARPDNGVEVVDDHTLRLHLETPSASLHSFLATGFAGIMPEGTSQEDLQQMPRGSGPFRIKSLERGAMWEYERNPAYFKEGLPYLDGIQLFLSRDFSASEVAFITGRVELNRASWSLSNRPVVEEMVANNRIVVRPYSTYCAPQGLLLNATKPPFDNPQLRHAINMGIDRKAYIEVVHNGNAEASLYLDTGGWGLSAGEIWEMPGFRQPKDEDLAEAQRIVRELYPDGLSVDLLSRNSGIYPRQSEFFTGELAKLGIEASVRLVDRAQLFPAGESLDYDIMSYYFCLTTGDPDELFGGYFITGASRNWLGYSNPRIDELYSRQSTELDRDKRRSLVLEMERIIYDDLPIIPTAVHNLTKNHYSHVKDVPIGLTSYTDERLERVWKALP